MARVNLERVFVMARGLFQITFTLPRHGLRKWGHCACNDIGRKLASRCDGCRFDVLGVKDEVRMVTMATLI